MPRLIPRTRSGLLMALLLGIGFWQLGRGVWIPAKAWLAQGLMQHAWLRAGAGAETARPWPWADTEPVARLSARGGEVELIVLAGGSGRVLAFAPGHLEASVLPGDAGNSVIAGHRDTHFRFLQYLQYGDIIHVERSNGRVLEFRVTGIDVVDARKGSVILDTDTPMLTLMTCYPFDAADPGGPLRYVVTATLAS
ncbi:MAG: class GN sortase [Woeseiaceae bacterium]|nr:class GN sortase [Woeseiaceae bacterium]